MRSSTAIESYFGRARKMMDARPDIEVTVSRLRQ